MNDIEILVIGSINIDHVMRVPHLPSPGETVTGTSYDTIGGGKGANQAVACARLGARTRFMANVGSDAFGAALVEQFSRDGIDVSLIKTVEAEKTGVALILVEEGAENCIGIAAGANETLSLEQVSRCEKDIARSDYLLMQLEIPLNSVMKAAAIARQHQVKVVLNPAPATPLPDSLLECVDIITPNQTEAEILTGIRVNDQGSAETAARFFHNKGIEVVVITMGSQGAFLSWDEGAALIAVPRVDALDTTAAGDTFNGAFLVGISKGMTMVDAVQFANRCAAIAVTRVGAQSSIPYLTEIG